MSLGGSFSQAVNDAAEYRAEFVPVVAANNANRNASRSSPASAQITVPGRRHRRRDRQQGVLQLWAGRGHLRPASRVKSGTARPALPAQRWPRRASAAPPTSYLSEGHHQRRRYPCDACERSPRAPAPACRNNRAGGEPHRTTPIACSNHRPLAIRITFQVSLSRKATLLKFGQSQPAGYSQHRAGETG